MTATQRIARVRRQYNQWVANQTLEDYALRFTAKNARRWSAGRVANTALGSVSFLALEAIGGAITLNYGFDNAFAAIVAVTVLILLTGLPIAYYAAKHGVDIDLLTRGAGFGYIGSTITSLIYASFTFIFFAIESVILAMALDMCFGIPSSAGYLIASLAIIPLVTHGFTFISRLQLWTQPLWLVLQILPFAVLAFTAPQSFDDWTGFSGRQGSAGFNLALFGAASTVLFSLVAQIGEQIDFLRFLPARRSAGDVKWWLALLTAGPGWIVAGAVKLLAGSYLVVLALDAGIGPDHAGEPTQMYLTAFLRVFDSPGLALALMGALVVLAQTKINVTNAYAGSIAWSNFFSRLTHSHPGRVVWLVFNVAIAVLLMESGVYEGLEQILGLYSIIAIAWTGSIAADLVINKPLGLSPPGIEFRRAHLYDINPVGLGSMVVATLAATAVHLGLLGDGIRTLAPFAALAAPMVSAPLIAWATGGRYYLARQPEPVTPATPEGLRQCCICEYAFEAEDMAHCPAYGGAICSLCCSLDARCHDSCKPNARIADQAIRLTDALFSRVTLGKTVYPIGRYLFIITATLALIAAVLYLIFFQTTLQAPLHSQAIGDAFLKVFVVMMIISGIATWLFVLAQESRRVAQEESMRQTTLLMAEIKAHQATDLKLQKAKEAAESANLAKTRYVVGISHELRAPLNAIFGYAQLLERDPAMPPHRREAIRVVRRSAEHLSGLIEGLLDISKIEGGHLHLHRDAVRLPEFLDQIVGMFRLQAQEKGLEFRFTRPDAIPEVVHTDEKRLRQILINLLSNALKFTESGFIGFHLRYRGQVAEMEIEDSGIGIREADLDRIFEPFERGRQSKAQGTPGTGLGLTITKLLTEILGGEISVTSSEGQGSRFRVRLLLTEAPPSATANAPTPVPRRLIHGYLGPRLTVLVADDDPAHRALLEDLLAPLGFAFLAAPDGGSCLDLAERHAPDLFLLDISMPDMDGWTLAQALRDQGFADQPIVMVSANALEYRRERRPEDCHDDFLLKPLDVTLLLESVGRLLGIQWITAEPLPEPSPIQVLPRLPDSAVGELRELAEIGYVRGLQAKLDELAAAHPDDAAAIAGLRVLVDRCELNAFAAALEKSAREGDQG